MKKILIYLSVIVISLSGCSPDDIKPIGEPDNWNNLVQGTWSCTSFIQIEEDAVFKGFPDFASKKDLTTIFTGHPYTDFRITFKADGTFSTELGNSYVDVLESGNWSLDNTESPAYIVLTSGSDTQNFSIGSLGGLVYDEFQLSIEKKTMDTQKAIISYELNLQK